MLPGRTDTRLRSPRQYDAPPVLAVEASSRYAYVHLRRLMNFRTASKPSTRSSARPRCGPWRFRLSWRISWRRLWIKS